MNRRGFTIVELLVVVVVTALLATIVTVAYNGVQRRATESVAQSLLRDAAKAMELHKVVAGSYPAELPNSVSVPVGFGLGMAGVADPQQEFCLNVTTQRFNDIFYSASQTQEIKSELCPGAVLATYGDYNNGSGSESEDEFPWLTASTAERVVAPGSMGFTVETNETWSQLALSWNAIEGATQYRVNHSTSASGDSWYARTTTNGSSAYSWNTTGRTDTSATLIPSITSLNWTSSAALPQNLASTHRYRIQYQNSSGVWSEWQELTLAPLSNHSVPAPANFQVTPNSDWSQITISWDSLGNYANLPGLQFRLNHSSQASGDSWNSRTATNGNSAYTWNGGSRTDTSATLSTSTTSLVWTGSGSKPANASQIHRYRIQIYSSTVQGPWSEVTLDPLNGEGLPTVTNFQVTPNSDWSKLTLSWNSVGALPNLPGTYIRINRAPSPGGTWSVLAPNAGSGYVWSYNNYSGTISPTDTELEWPVTSLSTPTVGNTYEYRIQVYSSSLQGPWTTTTLSR